MIRTLFLNTVLTGVVTWYLRLSLVMLPISTEFLPIILINLISNNLRNRIIFYSLFFRSVDRRGNWLGFRLCGPKLASLANLAELSPVVPPSPRPLPQHRQSRPLELRKSVGYSSALNILVSIRLNEFRVQPPCPTKSPEMPPMTLRWRCGR